MMSKIHSTSEVPGHGSPWCFGVLGEGVRYGNPDQYTDRPCSSKVKGKVRGDSLSHRESAPHLG